MKCKGLLSELAFIDRTLDPALRAAKSKSTSPNARTAGNRLKDLPRKPFEIFLQLRASAAPHWIPASGCNLALGKAS